MFSIAGLLTTYTVTAQSIGDSNISTKAGNYTATETATTPTSYYSRQHFARGISLTLKKKGATARAKHQTPRSRLESHYQHSRKPNFRSNFRITTPSNRTQRCHHAALEKAKAEAEAYIELEAMRASPPTPKPPTSLRLRT
jgi:hypothetical protein